jgi:GT2 family glycosyltransferase
MVEAVLEEALARRHTPGKVSTLIPGRHTRRLHIARRPRVSIVIPTRDQASLLSRCVEGIKRLSAYPDVDLIIVDNGTQEPRALAYLRTLERDHTVLRDPGKFNYSRLCNSGARQAAGECLLFLNNDVEVLHPDWLTAMVEHALRPEVGAVGCRLVFPNGRTQHAGVVVGLEGTAGHPFHGRSPDTPGYMGLDRVIRNCSAVTGACLMTRQEVFHEIGGFDERYTVVLGDIDFCLRLGRRGHLIVYTPEAVLIHRESATRPRGGPAEDIEMFKTRWKDLLAAGDPYYHPELTLKADGYRLKA